jgi:hypothetical protein
MSKLIITEQEKNLILSKYYPNQFLNEQKQFLSKLFGTSVDDIIKGLGDVGSKSLDDLFGKVLSKPTNIAIRQGNTFVRSASGKEIPIKQIKDVIELVSKGKLQPSQVLDYFPTKLADGSDFREVIKQALESKPKFKVDVDDFAQIRQNPVGGIFGNKFSGNRISNKSFGPADIDHTKILNWGGGLDNYNKTIATAIKTGDYKHVSSGGFEKFGITNLRDFLKNNIKTINEVDPSTGRWSVIFK